MDDTNSSENLATLTRQTIMKFLFALLATLFLAAPAWAVDVQMGSNGNLVFDPAEVTISAGESVHFVNSMLPPHNVVVEDHPEISHEGLAMMPGEEFDVTFSEAGDYTYWCGPHKGAGMIGTVHVQ
jgi:plastocyanin